MGIGTYNGNITIAAAGVANSPQTIAVQLTDHSGAAGHLAHPDDALALLCAQTTDALSQTFQVWNSSDQTLNYTISDNSGAG